MKKSKDNDSEKSIDLREKYLKIYEELRQEIKKGKYTEKIPSLKELVRRYDVCLTTANKAVTALIDEGLLYRQPGKGTFVENDRKPTSQKLVGIFMCASGHMYENLVRTIQDELHSKGFLALVIDFTNLDSTQFLHRVEEVVAMKPEAIIFQATHNSHGQLCADYLAENAGKIKKTVIILDAEGKGNLKATCILPDSWHGGYIATKHLIDLGHKQILHITNAPHLLSENPMPIHLYRETYTYKRILGYKMAMEEKGLKEEIIYDELNSRKLYKDIEIAFKRKDHPTAIFTRQDNVAVDVYKILKSLDLKVPEDVALVGYFNTPWSEMMDPPLTTVSIREEEFGRKIAETLTSKNKIIEQILIKPELIVRKSSGAKLKQ